MKKILILLFAVVAIAANAFEQGDFTYTIMSDGSARLDGFKSSYTGSPTTLTIPGYVYDSDTQKYYQVKTLQNSAFSNKTSINTVTIQYGVEEVTSYSFRGCTSLSEVYLPSSVKILGNYVFVNAPISQVWCAAETMPTINSNAFNNLGSVSGVRLWRCATPAGMNAANAESLITSNFTVSQSCSAADFHNNVMGTDGKECYVYYNITEGWNPSTQTKGKMKLLGAFPWSSNTTKTLEFPLNAIAQQGSYAQYQCTEIDQSFHNNSTDIKVLDMSKAQYIETIGNYAFYQCTNLTQAKVAAKNVGMYAFYGCSNLTSLQLYGTSESNCVQSLGAQCFANTGVSSVYIPKGLTTYGQGAFHSCANLSSFSVSSNNTSFSTYSSTPGCLFDFNKTKLYQVGGYINSTTLGTSMPNSLTTIAAQALRGNNRLTVFFVPYGVTEIQTYAFANMTSLTALDVPSSVTTFNTQAFYHLSALTLLVFNQNNIPSSLSSGTPFNGIKSGCCLKVPTWRTAHYQANSKWNAAFSGGISESSSDFSVAASSNKYLYYTVTSTASYLDTKVSNTATDGQVKVVNVGYGNNTYFSGTLTIPSTVTYRGKTYTVTEIERETFRDQTAITKVSGGWGIKKIGAQAFAGLTGCTSGFSMPAPVEYGDSALFNCATPTLLLGDRLERIGSYAFSRTNIQRILMPNTVTQIGRCIVAGAANLDSISISTGLKSIPDWGLAFCHARYIVLPYGVETIGSCVIQSDNTPSGMSTDYSRGNVIVIPSSVTSIASDAFYWARHLDEIYLNVPYGVFTSVKNDWCRRAALDASNAYDWSGHKLYVPVGQLQQYRNDAGIKACWDENNDVLCGSFDFSRNNDFMNETYRMTVVDKTARTAKFVYVPEWHTGSGTYTVAPTASQTDFRTGISYQMVEIADSAFVNHKISKFTIPATITRIGAYAFKDCSWLNQEVSIPEAVDEIGSYAFYGCTSLPSIFINRSGDNTLIGNLCWNSTSTANTDGIKLYVPLDQYYYQSVKTKTWLPNVYANRSLLPYIKPSTEWTLFSVPVPDLANGNPDWYMLPSDGEFYYGPNYDTSSNSLVLSKLDQTRRYQCDGMMLKGDVGTIYRFRDGTYSVYSFGMQNNLLKGFNTATRLIKSTTENTCYTFDGTEFEKVSESGMVLSSGLGYLQLPISLTSSPETVDLLELTDADYDLFVGGTKVTSANANDLSVINGVTGTVKYDPITRTLTIRDAIIKHGDNSVNTGIGILNRIQNLTIDVQGTNRIVLEGGSSVGSLHSVQAESSMTIKGTGTLECINDSSSCIRIKSINGAHLNIQGGVHLNLKGEFSALYNDYKYNDPNYECVTISGADTKVTMWGNQYTTYYVLPNLNDGLVITQPIGAHFSSNGIVLDANNSRVSGQEVVISKPGGLRGDINGDGKVDVSDVNIVINIMLGKAQASSYPGNADVNSDNKVDVSDVNLIINIMLGKA